MREVIGNSVACNHHKVGFVGLLVTLGIVFGDIGTSPLYVMKAILHTGETIDENTILGALSCIIGHSPYKPPSNMYVWRCVLTTKAREVSLPSMLCSSTQE